LTLQFGDPPARPIEASNFVLRLLWQIRKPAQHSANRARRRRRRKKMTLTRARVRSANFVRAKVNDSWLAKCRSEGVKLTLPHVTQLESIGLERPRASPARTWSASSHVCPMITLLASSRGIFVELRQTLRGNDSSETALAALAHQADDCVG
jgi:hypothetical protein